MTDIEIAETPDREPLPPEQKITETLYWSTIDILTGFEIAGKTVKTLIVGGPANGMEYVANQKPETGKWITQADYDRIINAVANRVAEGKSTFSRQKEERLMQRQAVLNRIAEVTGLTEDEINLI